MEMYAKMYAKVWPYVNFSSVSLDKIIEKRKQKTGKRKKKPKWNFESICFEYNLLTDK